MYNDTGATVSIQDSIFWGDTLPEIVNNPTGTSALNDSIVQGSCPLSGSTCTNVLGGDPLLGAFQDNGGFTETMALGAGSPALDAGNDLTCDGRDQRALTRPQGPHCDMGAYEYVSGPILFGNAGIAGATLTDSSGSTTSDGGGFFAAPVPNNWTGTLAPSKTGSSFTPVWRSYSNVTTNQSDQNFTAGAKLFADVPVAGLEWMQPWIEQFYYSGITSGCGIGPLIYCPSSNATRAEMAIFILRAIHGMGYAPPAASHFFTDMPVTGKEWMEPWVDEFYREGLTSGCAVSPLRYCPENNVTRAEMAVFILRAIHGSLYSPPLTSGVFSDMPVVGKEWMESWVDEFHSEGITSGCALSPLRYCPENNVTRAEMAVFIDRAFHFMP
jgi:hypothetical protein